MKVGDVAAIIGILVWLSVCVGPWWMGIVIFYGALVINIIMIDKEEDGR